MEVLGIQVGISNGMGANQVTLRRSKPMLRNTWGENVVFPDQGNQVGAGRLEPMLSSLH